MIQPLFVFGDIGIAFLRVVLGIILIVHGWPKIKSIKGTAEWMGQTFKPGIFWAVVVSIIEFIGGILIVFGFLVQPIAILVALEFIVAMFKVNWGKGFVSGYEYDFLVLATAIALSVLGSGAYSVDKLIGLLLY